MDQVGRRAGTPSGAASDFGPPESVVEVVSDAICPWCCIGKRQLERAMTLVGPVLRPRVAWLPFQLNPDMPKEGLDRRRYRTAKFGSLEHSQRLDAQVARAGRTVGLEFRHDRMERTPNTFDAHRLVWLAGREGAQDAVVEGLFAAYFTRGRDIGDKAVLADIAEEAGLERARVAAMLAGEEGLEEVRGEEERARRLGLSGVPTFLIGGRPLLAGARPAQELAAVLLASAGEDGR